MDRSRASEPSSGAADCRRFEELLAAERAGDAAIDGEDRLFLERHRQECAECDGFVRMLDRLPSIAPVAHPADTAALAAAAFRRYRRERRLRVGALLAASVALAAAAGTFAALRASDPAAAAVLVLEQGEVDAGGRRLGVGDPLRSGARFTVVGPAVRLHDSRGVRLGLSGTTRASVVAGPAGGLEVRLDEGIVAVEVAPRPESAGTVAVATSAGTVEVRGTVFGVEAAGGIVRVDVLRGEVAVRWGPDRAWGSVGAAMSFDLALGERGRLAAPRRDRVIALLGLPPEATVAAAPLPVPAAEPAPAPAAEPPRVVRPAVAAGPGVPAGPRSVESIVGIGPGEGGGRPRVALAPSASAPPRAEPILSTDPPDASDLLRAARVTRSARDWEGAGAIYRRLLELYPDSPEAQTARVGLGELLLSQGADPGAAVRLFEQYLERSAQGPLAEEASYGVCRALRASGRFDEERRALERFLASHPSSPRAAAVRDRLQSSAGVAVESSARPTGGDAPDLQKPAPDAGAGPGGAE